MQGCSQGGVEAAHLAVPRLQGRQGRAAFSARHLSARARPDFKANAVFLLYSSKPRSLADRRKPCRPA